MLPVATLRRVSRWTSVYYLWPPNLPDEGCASERSEGNSQPRKNTNHLIELAFAGGAATIITANRRDLARGELIFPGLKIQTAGEFLETYKRSKR